MRALEAMILWTPNRDGFQGKRLTGTISVTTIPEPAGMKEHAMSVGACDLDWRETDDRGRHDLMQRYFTQMLHRDKLNVNEIYQAISAIDEFSGQEFSIDAPEGDDWQ